MGNRFRTGWGRRFDMTSVRRFRCLTCAGLSPRPFQCADEFLLRRQQLRAVYLRQRLSLVDIAAREIHMEFLDPPFDLCIDCGKPPFVRLNPSYRPDDLPQRPHRDLDRLDADELLLLRGNFDLRGFLHHFFLRDRLPDLRFHGFGLLNCRRWLRRMSRMALGKGGSGKDAP